MVVQTEDTAVKKLLAVDGIGLVPFPGFAVNDLVRTKQLIKLGSLDAVHDEYWLVSAERRIENPIAAAVMKGFGLKE